MSKCEHGIHQAEFTQPGEFVGGLVVEFAGECLHLLVLGGHLAVTVKRPEGG